MGKISRKALPPRYTPHTTTAATAISSLDWAPTNTFTNARPTAPTMSVSESYQLASLPSVDVDAGKPPSPSADSIDLSQVRWLENQRSRGWEVGKIVLRASSTFFCSVTLALCLAWYSYAPNIERAVWPGLLLIGAIPGFFWDLAEFLTVCARHGRGITPKAHIGVEVVISLMAAAAAAWVGLQLQLMDEDAALVPYTMPLSASIFTGLSGRVQFPSSLIFSCPVARNVLTFGPESRLIHFLLFIRACIERRREIRRRRPRVMFIPETGQTVYVVAKPFPKMPTWRSQQSARTQSLPQSPQSHTSHRFPPLHVDVPDFGSPAYFDQTQSSPAQPPPLPDRPSAPSPAIKRKPVRGFPPGIAPADRDRHLKPSMRPPPDDYVPDEAELERMRRGDAQPQLIMPGDVDFKFATSATGMTPADADSREGKFRINVPMMPAAAGESSSLGSRNTGGRTRSL